MGVKERKQMLCLFCLFVFMHANTYSRTKQKQGRESRDLFCLFCTCIRTERVRKFFLASLIHNEFSSGKEPCLYKQQLKAVVFYFTCCSFLHNLEQNLSVFARGCVKKKTVSMETAPG